MTTDRSAPGPPALLGWRVWIVDTDFPAAVLQSPYRESAVEQKRTHPWTSAAQNARCGHRHTPPAEECTCGLYADPDSEFLSTLVRVIDIGWRISESPKSFRIVIGRVILSGAVVLETRFIDPQIGQPSPEYRAAHARITGLWIPGIIQAEPPPHLIPALMQRYAVPVATGFPSLALTAQPQPIPTDIQCVGNRSLSASVPYGLGRDLLATARRLHRTEHRWRTA